MIKAFAFLGNYGNEYKDTRHNAGFLRSIKGQLGTSEFWRIRIGIGRPACEQADIADYVLSRFTKSELETLQFQLPVLNELIAELLQCKSDEALHALLPARAKVKPDV